MLALQTVNVGAAANDGTGDPLRTGGQKINANFEALGRIRNAIEAGELQIFKHPDNNVPGNENVIEPKDAIRGWFDANTFVHSAVYSAGNVGVLASYIGVEKSEYV